MEYYVEPDSGHEDFIRIAGPEDISLCDPACGSGHILVYAFELLSKMYLERGYREREIPGLVLSKNLHGMEIDPRAAQIARLALAMCARGLDRRFFGRGVRADIAVLAPVALGEGDVPQGSALAKRRDLLDALAHLDEVGSLLAPAEGDLAAIREAIDLTGGGLFGGSSKEKLRRALSACEVLSRRHDCVVANPPYMGSSSFGPFMSKWVKKSYPDVKSDLFSSFVVRMFNLAKDHGECGVMSPFVWMFIGSYEKLRNEIIDNRTLTSLIQLEYSGFAGATVPICTYTFHNSFIKGYKGGYVRLSDFVGASVQAPKALEAIKNPDCGWFYRRDAETFRQIPGAPIAYWASDGLIESFRLGESLGKLGKTSKGLITGDNDFSLRLWWECPQAEFCTYAVSGEEANLSGKKWFPCNKGGMFRKWDGNHDYVVLWGDGGAAIFGHAKNTGHHSQDYSVELKFQPNISWSDISSGAPAFRFRNNEIAEHCGMPYFPQRVSLLYCLGLLNSSVSKELFSFLSPTLHLNIGELEKVPLIDSNNDVYTEVENIVTDCVIISKNDWNLFENSWDFLRHPLI